MRVDLPQDDPVAVALHLGKEGVPKLTVPPKAASSKPTIRVALDYIVAV